MSVQDQILRSRWEFLEYRMPLCRRYLTSSCVRLGFNPRFIYDIFILDRVAGISSALYRFTRLSRDDPYWMSLPRYYAQWLYTGVCGEGKEEEGKKRNKAMCAAGSRQPKHLRWWRTNTGDSPHGGVVKQRRSVSTVEQTI